MRSHCDLSVWQLVLQGYGYKHIFLMVLLILPGVLAHATDSERTFYLNIPNGRAEESLKLLSRQTGYPVLFQADDVKDIATPSLQGRYSLREALAELFKGTPLSGSLTHQDVITISREQRIKNEVMEVNGKRSFRGMISAALVAAFGVSEAVNGQEVVSAGPRTIEEVVVTAQRRSESLRDVPIAMTAVTPETAQQFGLNNIQDISMVTPSLDVTTSPGFLKIYTRGIGQAFVTPGLEAPTAIYLDGGYIQRLGGFNSLLDLVDIDRVEVLRGPQGTLYGRNATGGALLLHTADPGQEFEGRLAGEYGRFNHRQVDGMVNIPLTDTLSARFAARTLKSDGYIKNVATGRDLHGDDSYTIRGKLRWQPNDLADMVLGVEYQENTPRKAVNQRAFGPPNCFVCQTSGDGPLTGFYKTDQNDRPPWDISLFRATLNATFSFGDFELASNTGFLDDEAIQLSDTDATSSPVFNYENNGIGGETFTQEIVLSSQYAGPLNFLAGLSYVNDDGFIDIALEGSAYAFFPDFPANYSQVETESISGFAEITYDITDNITVTVGGRYTRDERSLDAVNNAGFQAFGLPASFAMDDEFDAFTPRFVVSWSNDNTNIYYSYTEAFKAGGFVTPATAPRAAVDPEEIKGHEIGIKHAAFDNRLNTNLAIFYYEDRDFHSQVVDATGGGNITQNAGGLDGQGVELEINTLPADGLAVGASLSYLDVEFSSYENAAAVCVDPSGTGNPFSPGAILVSCSLDLGGNRVPHAPEVSGSIYASYDFFLGDWNANLSGLVRHSSSYDFNPGAGGQLDHDKQDAYTVANFSGYIRPPGSGLQLGFYLDNAFDKEYTLYRSTNAPYGANYVVDPEKLPNMLNYL